MFKPDIKVKTTKTTAITLAIASMACAAAFYFLKRR
jgi:hypothetical protein